PAKAPPPTSGLFVTGQSVSGLEITFRPDPTIGDGALSNNAWLQELPKPQNKMTWDNAAWISPETAKKSGLDSGDIVTIEFADRGVEAAVWVMEGQADDSVAVVFGYGRSHAGNVAGSIGFNAYLLRTSSAPWRADGVRISRKSGGYSFAVTQHTETMEGR